MKARTDTDRFFSFDLDSVKATLRTGELSETYLQLKYLAEEVYQDESASRYFFHQLPKVPAFCKWELVAHLQLNPEVLARAIEHPSQGICQNAALLIKYGSGGQESVKLARKIIGEDEWKAFEES